MHRTDWDVILTALRGSDDPDAERLAGLITQQL